MGKKNRQKLLKNGKEEMELFSFFFLFSLELNLDALKLVCQSVGIRIQQATNVLTNFTL